MCQGETIGSCVVESRTCADEVITHRPPGGRHTDLAEGKTYTADNAASRRTPWGAGEAKFSPPVRARITDPRGRMAWSAEAAQRPAALTSLRHPA